MLSSAMVALFYIHASNAQEFQSIPILTSGCFLFGYKPSNGCAVVFHCGLDFHFPNETYLFLRICIHLYLKVCVNFKLRTTYEQCRKIFCDKWLAYSTKLPVKYLRGLQCFIYIECSSTHSSFRPVWFYYFVVNDYMVLVGIYMILLLEEFLLKISSIEI